MCMYICIVFSHVPTCVLAFLHAVLVSSFQFGGKLVTFENAKPQQQPGIDQQPQRHYVYVSQVVTEKEFLARSTQLQEAVQSEGFVSYCQKKVDMAQADFERNVWAFLKVTVRAVQEFLIERESHCSKDFFSTLQCFSRRDAGNEECGLWCP